jgi:hypothetical protein
MTCKIKNKRSSKLNKCVASLVLGLSFLPTLATADIAITGDITAILNQAFAHSTTMAADVADFAKNRNNLVMVVRNKSSHHISIQGVYAEHGNLANDPTPYPHTLNKGEQWAIGCTAGGAGCNFATNIFDHTDVYFYIVEAATPVNKVNYTKYIHTPDHYMTMDEALYDKVDDREKHTGTVVTGTGHIYVSITIGGESSGAIQYINITDR